MDFRTAITACALVATSLLGNAQAQIPTVEALRAYVEREAIGALPPSARLDVSIGSVDSRVQLAPCARAEPFIPASARLWGRTSVGLRCMQGASWSVLIPVTVRVYGPALAAMRPLAAGSAPAREELQTIEAEWTREPQGVVSDLAQLDNRVLARSLAAGQPIPLAALRAPQVISQGDPVRVIGQGRGFAVTADAIALAAAQDGQSVRVRTESGRVLTGTARAGRRVEVVF